MRLAIALPAGFGPPDQPRAIPAIDSLVARLARRHQVRVIVFEQRGAPARYERLGAEVRNLGPLGGPPGARLVARAAQVARHLDGVSLVHAFWANHVGAAVGLAARMRRRPFVLSIAGGEQEDLREIGYGGARGPKGRALVGLGRALADRLTAGSRAVAPDARWIPLGAETARFTPGPHDRPRIAHAASIHPVKDPETLLASFARVAAVRPEVELDWVGEDVSGGRARRMAENLGLAERIVFHGLLDGDAVARVFGRAQVYLHTSRFEAQCVAALEAAATGLPIVGTAVGILPEIAGAGIARVGDARGLAGHVLALLGDEEARRRAGESARAFAVAHDADFTARAFEALYAELV